MATSAARCRGPLLGRALATSMRVVGAGLLSAALAAGCHDLQDDCDLNVTCPGAGGGAEPSSTTGTTGGDPCPVSGQIRCAGAAQPETLICDDTNNWANNASCSPGMLCDSSLVIPSEAICKPVVGACAGKTPDQVVCEGLDAVRCGADLVSKTLVETCLADCLDGTCVDCTPAKVRCFPDNTLKTCDPTGKHWTDTDACQGMTCVGEACTGSCSPGGTECLDSTPRCDPTTGACVSPPSCFDLSASCGPPPGESCCTSNVVQGGLFNRDNDTTFPATVSDFRLDRFEVTVGRFRKFVEGYPANQPMMDAGAHPRIADSGWNAAWTTANALPADRVALINAVKYCNKSNYATWTDSPGNNENKPMNCLTWYEAFAFCAWDGGRLPTEAEWNYAAAGGNEQRIYPWGSSIAPANAAYCTSAQSCTPSPINVGVKAPGNARWGQADMAGNVAEWTLDYHDGDYLKPCMDCARLTPGPAVPPGTGNERVKRGGSSLNKGADLKSSVRNYFVPTGDLPSHGVRCARGS